MLPFLSGYDHSLMQFLEAGFTFGFQLHFDGPRCSQEAPNLLSAMQNPEAVNAKLSKELDAHRLAGPFSSPPFPVFRVSPLGLVPKKVEGEFRLIHHLSYPRGSSLNDGISLDYTSVSYATVEDAIGLIKSVGQNCFLAKTDIKNAFRLFLFALPTMISWAYTGKAFTIMIGACLWAVQVPVKLLRCFQLPLNGLPRTSCIFLIFCIC